MDRDNNWDRVEQAYDMLTLGTGVQCTNPVKEVLGNAISSPSNCASYTVKQT